MKKKRFKYLKSYYIIRVVKSKAS